MSRPQPEVRVLSKKLAGLESTDAKAACLAEESDAHLVANMLLFRLRTK